MTWYPITTAPRNGTPVILTGCDQVEEHLMTWNPEGHNSLVQAPGEKGIWEGYPNQGFTWKENIDGGPMFWRYWKQS